MKHFWYSVKMYVTKMICSTLLSYEDIKCVIYSEVVVIQRLLILVERGWQLLKSVGANSWVVTVDLLSPTVNVCLVKLPNKSKSMSL